MRRTSLKRGEWSRTPAIKPKLPINARIGKETTKELKVEIQAKLRAFVIVRDGGCWLRNYPEAGACGGRKNNGDLILQAEHLHTRSNSANYQT